MTRILQLCLSIGLLSLACRAENGLDSGSVATTPATDTTRTSTVVANSTAVTTTNNTNPYSNATCSGRTVNYITHTLPQQCLRAHRSQSFPTTRNGERSITPSFSSPSSASPLSQAAIPAGGDSKTTLVQIQPAESTISYSAYAASAPKSDVQTASVLATGSHLSALPQPEPAPDSALDNANFLSFEDWKKRNLANAGQSAENLGSRSQPVKSGRKHPGVDALDTLGEESEIDLDFSGFGGSPSPKISHLSEDQRANTALPDNAESGKPSPASQALRPRDAGKTCKERTNYASFDCAATVLKSNTECKSASSVLVENKDSYLLNKCSAGNKFFIVELCNDILVDTIVLANYEFFSSIFRHFRVSVSDRYPVKAEKWKDLGTFEAHNTREVQAFLIENPLIWARYVRIEFLTHYGSEYYCPVSLLRIHGTTMMEEFRNQEEIARGESQDEEATHEVEPTVIVPALPEGPTIKSSDQAHTVVQDKTSTSRERDDVESSDTVRSSKTLPSSDTSSSMQSSTNVVKDLITRALFTFPADASASTCAGNASTAVDRSNTAASSILMESQSMSIVSTVTPKASEKSSSSEVKEQSEASLSTVFPSSGSDNKTTTFIKPRGDSMSPTASHISSSQPSASTTATAVLAGQNSTLKETGSGPSTANSTKAPATSTSAPQPQPSTQESFFKSIHKRLQQLESNSTLSLQYIEEQSRILRDAFGKVEKRQISTATSFLSHLNDTVMTELHGFRQAYDQLWQSTVIELESQREHHQREMTALSSRLTFVADELIWQKRMGIVQSTLLLLCLGLVLFARSGGGALDVPLLQQVMTKSHAAFRSGYDSEPHSASPASRSPVSLLRRSVWLSNTEPPSGNATDRTDSRPQSRGDGLLGPLTQRLADAMYDDDDIVDATPQARNEAAFPDGDREHDIKRPPGWPNEVERPSDPHEL